MSYPLQISLRILAATAGGYATSVATSFALVTLLYHLGGSLLSDGVYYSVMLAYPIFFTLFILSFSIKSVPRLYQILCFIALLSMLIHWLGGPP